MPVHVARAATIIVNGFTDESDIVTSCTLREAVQASNTNVVQSGCPAGSPGPDTIQLPAGTYSLTAEGDDPAMTADVTAGDLDVTEDLAIVGDGAATTTIRWGSSVSDPDRILDVTGSGTDLTLSGVTIREGETDGLGDGGGAVRTGTGTTLTITGAVLTANFVFEGGAIANVGIATLTDVTITENTGSFRGGGISNGGTMTLIDVTLAGNSTQGGEGDGGGIYNQGTLTVDRVAFHNNDAATVGDGAALANDGGTATLTNVTMSGNVAGHDGGGLFNEAGTMTLNNATITGNTADGDNGGGGQGGGIARIAGTVNIRNTIVAGNVDITGENPDCFGVVTSQGHNLVQNTAGCTGLAGPGEITGQDPKLGPLADNGGPTQTHALLAGSPAIDAGGPDCAPTDQRGLPRNCDIGAYELVRCQGVPVNRIGTDAPDVLSGTGGPDGFLAGAGNDRVAALGGNDGGCLGLGGDRANGGAGNDRLSGEGGRDRLTGAGGRDRLRGGPGRDRCSGGAGRDRGAGCEGERKIP